MNKDQLFTLTIHLFVAVINTRAGRPIPVYYRPCVDVARRCFTVRISHTRRRLAGIDRSQSDVGNRINVFEKRSSPSPPPPPTTRLSNANQPIKVDKKIWASGYASPSSNEVAVSNGPANEVSRPARPSCCCHGVTPCCHAVVPLSSHRQRMRGAACSPACRRARCCYGRTF